jgi:hypothetical protein
MARDPDRPTVPEVLALVRAYYALPGNAAGGNCHLVLDDGNVEDGNIRFCLEACEAEGDAPGARLMGLMLRMTRTQRNKVRAMR